MLVGRERETVQLAAGDGNKELLAERALSAEHLAEADLAARSAAMDDARARRLQPHYIELACGLQSGVHPAWWPDRQA